jgi:hypothetical protein
VQLGAELRLTKRVGFETLLYQADERLVDHGKLIFNVAPTKDGNRRLSIYAAFDYKKGKGFASRMMWKGARLLFPRIRARRRVEPCPVHNQGGGRAEARLHPRAMERPPETGRLCQLVCCNIQFLTMVTGYCQLSKVRSYATLASDSGP